MPCFVWVFIGGLILAVVWLVLSQVRVYGERDEARRRLKQAMNATLRPKE